MAEQQGGILIPEMAQQFPAHLKETFLNTNYSCQICENRYTVQLTAADGKKSKSWSMGALMWGVGDKASLCECLIIKCPSCGQPGQTVIVSKRQLVNDLIKGQESQIAYKPKPATPGAQQARTILKPITTTPTKGPIKK